MAFMTTLIQMTEQFLSSSEKSPLSSWPAKNSPFIWYFHLGASTETSLPSQAHLTLSLALPLPLTLSIDLPHITFYSSLF